MTHPSFVEPVLEPALPIVDAHHHLWLLPETTLTALEAADAIYARALAPTIRRHARYLFDEFFADATSGHNVRASVFAEAQAMYPGRGHGEMESVWEVEFVNGIAAMAASGVFCDVKMCAAIVGSVDLRLGDTVEQVLSTHIQAGGGRYRGVRSHVVYDDDPNVLAGGTPRILFDANFRSGFRRLHPLGLSFEAWILEPQLPDLIDLARAYPDTQIILNHVGAPVGIGQYAGQRELRFPLWRDNIRTLSRSENVAVKLGGLGIPFGGFKTYKATPAATSEELAAEWKPYIETCIEAFGVHRCMFESNFPVDSAAGSYSVVWNAFKRLTAGASKEEKTALFSATATRIYRLDV